MLPRAGNEKLHVTEYQSPWYTHGMNANFNLSFPNDILDTWKFAEKARMKL